MPTPENTTSGLSSAGREYVTRSATSDEVRNIAALSTVEPSYVAEEFLEGLRSYGTSMRRMLEAWLTREVSYSGDDSISLGDVSVGVSKVFAAFENAETFMVGSKDMEEVNKLIDNGEYTTSDAFWGTR